MDSKSASPSVSIQASSVEQCSRVSIKQDFAPARYTDCFQQRISTQMSTVAPAGSRTCLHVTSMVSLHGWGRIVKTVRTEFLSTLVGASLKSLPTMSTPFLAAALFERVLNPNKIFITFHGYERRRYAQYYPAAKFTSHFSTTGMRQCE